MLGEPSSDESSVGSRSEWNRTPTASSSSIEPTARTNEGSRDQRSRDHTRTRSNDRSGRCASSLSRSYSVRSTRPVPVTFSR